MVSNPCRLHALLPGKCEATRGTPTVCGRKHANCSRVHPARKRNRVAPSLFDTAWSRSYQSSASRNQQLWLSRQRSRGPSRAQTHRHRAGSRNLRRGMKNSSIATLPFLLICSSSSAFELFICNVENKRLTQNLFLLMAYILHRSLWKIQSILLISK